MPAEAEVRTAGSADATPVARLLYDFNTEFGWPMPPVEELAPRLAELIEGGEALVLLVGETAGAAGAESDPEPLGLAVLRLRPALISRGRDAYLEELYVVPGRRGEGLGRALLEATLAAARGAGGRADRAGNQHRRRRRPRPLRELRLHQPRRRRDDALLRARPLRLGAGAGLRRRRARARRRRGAR